MEDARNFRSIYYEKVGCRSVEEKKSLEILLKVTVRTSNYFRQDEKELQFPSPLFRKIQ